MMPMLRTVKSTGRVTAANGNATGKAGGDKTISKNEQTTTPKGEQ